MGCAASTPAEGKRDNSARLGLNVDMPPPAASDFKIIMAGDLAVGKSCVVKRFTAGRFDATLPATIGGAFMAKEVVVQGDPHDATVKLLVWDTAGEELYRAMTKSFFKGAVGGIILYDVGNAKSLASVPGWVADYRDHNPAGVLVVAGNKSDLAPEKQRVTEEEAEAAVEVLRPGVEADGGAIVHMRVSAMTGVGVNEAFMLLASTLAQRTLGLRPPGAAAAAGGAS